MEWGQHIKLKLQRNTFLSIGKASFRKRTDVLDPMSFASKILQFSLEHIDNSFHQTFTSTSFEYEKCKDAGQRVFKKPSYTTYFGVFNYSWKYRVKMDTA